MTATQSSDTLTQDGETENPFGTKSESKPNAMLPSVGSTSSSVHGSKVPVFTGERLEIRLHEKDLKILMSGFHPDGVVKTEVLEKNESLKLDRDEFSTKLSTLVNKGTKEEYAELFDRIDITKSGRVTWDAFVQFMLYEFLEKDEKVKTTQVPQWKELRIIQTPHKDTIERIQHMRSSNRYLSMSREGCISFWDHHLKLQKSLKLATESVKPRDLWVTDFVLLPNLNKIAVSFTSKEIAFYDLGSKVEFNCQYKLKGLHSTPLCMDFYGNPEDPNEAILVYGDVGGQVSALCFSSAQIALFDRPQREASDNKQQNNATVYVRLKELVRDTSKHKNCRFVHHIGHKGWVRQVKYAEHLECFISCSTGREKTIILGFIEKASTTMRTTSFRFHHGVHCFDYHQQMNLIATGSVNNHVCLWNPYVISKPVGILTGHMAAVVRVTINFNRQQLMSFSVDKVLRVWDIQQQVCLQRLAGIFPKGPEVQTILYFDDIKNRLFVTFNYQLTMLEMKIEIRDRVMTHERPVTAAIYNNLYNQVVTTCQDGTVNMWMIDNGQKVKQFTNCHGNHEITALAFDDNETRFLTASTDGTVKIWDFNGHCHHLLMAGRDNPADIAQVVVMKRSILAIGWDRYITAFRSMNMTQYHLQSVDWKGGQEHQDDILSAAYSSPTTLATGSYDGEIIIWNTQSEHVSRKLQARCRQRWAKRPVTGAEIEAISRPTTSESQTSELEFSFVISSLVFLKTRMNGGNPTGTCADLVSCGGGGWVRFWNVNQTNLMSEFVAHSHAGNAICATDSEDHYLITGDSDGAIKVWFIKNYLMNDSGHLVSDPPPVHASWQPHADAINCINTCIRNDRLLVITASSDCSVSLSDIHGNHIGEFGQDQHWRIDVIPQEKSEDEEENVDSDLATDKEEQAEENDVTNEQPEFIMSLESKDDFIYDPEFRASTWDSTVLGKAYQESRLNKRERKQPSTINGYKEHIEESAVGPYGILDYNDLAPMPSMKKPDFMLHPHKYFGEKQVKASGKKEESEEAPVIKEARGMLKAAFDERTLFPKELLDFEAQVRNEHAQKLRSSMAIKKKPVSILKSFVSSNLMTGSTNSLGGSKMGSRIGSSIQDKRNVAKRIPSTSTLNMGVDPGKMSGASFSKVS
ncbi:cilia- and flagella-associated protein 337-like [Styela clava]